MQWNRQVVTFGETVRSGRSGCQEKYERRKYASSLQYQRVSHASARSLWHGLVRIDLKVDESFMPVAVFIPETMAGDCITACGVRREINIGRSIWRNLKTNVIAMNMQFSRFIGYPAQLDSLFVSKTDNFVANNLTIFDADLNTLRLVSTADALFGRSKI